jgi:hypothetical protein
LFSWLVYLLLRFPWKKDIAHFQRIQLTPMLRNTNNNKSSTEVLSPCLGLTSEKASHRKFHSKIWPEIWSYKWKENYHTIHNNISTIHHIWYTEHIHTMFEVHPPKYCHHVLVLHMRKTTIVNLIAKSCHSLGLTSEKASHRQIHSRIWP